MSDIQLSRASLALEQFFKIGDQGKGSEHNLVAVKHLHGQTSLVPLGSKSVDAHTNTASRALEARTLFLQAVEAKHGSRVVDLLNANVFNKDENSPFLTRQNIKDSQFWIGAHTALAEKRDRLLQEAKEQPVVQPAADEPLYEAIPPRAGTGQVSDRASPSPSHASDVDRRLNQLQGTLEEKYGVEAVKQALVEVVSKKGLEPGTPLKLLPEADRLLVALRASELKPEALESQPEAILQQERRFHLAETGIIAKFGQFIWNLAYSLVLSKFSGDSGEGRLTAEQFSEVWQTADKLHRQNQFVEDAVSIDNGTVHDGARRLERYPSTDSGFLSGPDSSPFDDPVYDTVVETVGSDQPDRGVRFGDNVSIIDI